MGRKIGFLLAGVFFGFTLSRSGASDYNYIYHMFTGENLKLALLMGTAIIVAAIGMIILKALGNKDVKGSEESCLASDGLFREHARVPYWHR